ncbi:MAG: RAMP superfamily CRISPR-associated protein, partial [Methanomassiliicoccales archaeon]
MEILKIIIETTTAFHTSGGRIGSTIDILRDKYIQNGATKERFIIPATHIKGVLRSEAKRIWGQNKRIVELFGVEEQEGTQGYQEPVLKFTDAWSSNSIVAERTHVSIDRSTGSHTERELFMENVIPARSI